MKIELKADFIYEKAEPDVGVKESVEIIGASVVDESGKELFVLSTQQYSFMYDNHLEALDESAWNQIEGVKNQ